MFPFQIASHSKSSTKSRFWNRSFHILSCDRNMKPSDIEAPSGEAQTSIALNKSIHSENRRDRLDRTLKHPLMLSWSRCNWRPFFLVPLILVLLNLTSIECLQPRQEGTCAVLNSRLAFQLLFNYTIYIFSM